MSYEELCKEIVDAPETWLPGLLQRTVRTVAVKKVFQDKAAMMRFTERAFDMGGVGQTELRTTHVFQPDPKYSHFCKICGYPKAEKLQYAQ